MNRWWLEMAKVSLSEIVIFISLVVLLTGLYGIILSFFVDGVLTYCIQIFIFALIFNFLWRAVVAWKRTYK